MKSRAPRILRLALAVLLVPLGAGLTVAQPGPTPATVTRVIDGTTIEVGIGDRRAIVRYVGIRTPEIQRPGLEPESYAEAATEANRRLVEDKRVLLTFDVQPWDQYGLLLAYAYVHGTHVNAELVELGYAEATSSPPNIRHAAHLRGLQRLAFLGRRGLWAEDEARTLYRPRGSGVIGRRRNQLYYHLDDAAVSRIPSGEEEFFESATQADEAGYAPSPEYPARYELEAAFLRGLVGATGPTRSPGGRGLTGASGSPGRATVRGYYQRDGTFVRLTKQGARAR